jgi:NAD(P)-dependent dehydrogenase (short-subunit alcohol dehydrogenase family)
MGAERKIAIVTGAGSGIGKATTLALLKEAGPRFDLPEELSEIFGDPELVEPDYLDEDA